MAAADEPTLGEIMRSLQRLEKSQADTSKKIDELKFVRIDVWAVEKEQLERDITGLGARLDNDIAVVRDDLTKTQDTLTWLARAIIGAFVVAAVAALVAAAVH